MSDKIKVVGYAQRVFLGDGIEYRNFTEDLVGNQQTEGDDGTGANSNFTLNNFVITTNFEGRTSRLYDTKKFSDFITLNTLDISSIEATKLLSNNINIKINLDNTNLSNFAYFGSATEFVRVSLENIITSWPASLYMVPSRLNNLGVTTNGFTVLNYNYDLLLNKAKFTVDTNFINNKFDINYQKNGNIVDTFNEGNDLRNLSANFSSYVILVGDDEYPIIGYSGSENKLNDYINFEVYGDPFKVSGGTNLMLRYHIKPKNLLVEEFFNSLNGFESNLLNRLVTPKYTSEYDYQVESDTGVLINRSQKLTWPVTDGYNIDFSTNDYTEFVTKLVEISNDKDALQSNLVARFLTSESISDFDTLPTCDGNTQETSGQKMNKTLKIYGREFDEVKKYIDGISYANVVTYDKKDNTPDQLVKNLARILGWELVSSVLNEDLVSSYLLPKKSSLLGQSRGLTAQEADIEMWRRLILNSAWIWKSKGTRKAVEFFFKFIGAPEGLINFNEFVYSVKSPINMELFMSVLENNNLDTNLDFYNVDSEGYPKFFDNTSDMYFQKGGKWYRETGGANATQNISTGNNPHVGPYDNGREYINQLNNIIPSFSAFTLTSTTTTTSSEQLFSNYNSGIFNGYSGPTYFNVVDEEGQNFSSIVTITPTIISDPCPQSEQTDCGCDVDEDDEAIKIDIQNRGVCLNLDCDSMFNRIDFNQLDDLYLFNYKVYNMDGSESTTINKESKFGPRECCSGLLDNRNNPSRSYYHEEFQYTGMTETNVQVFISEPKNSGYICCSSNGIESDLGLLGCGKELSCQWQLVSTNISDMWQFNEEPGLVFLTFKDPRGNSRLVNVADSGFCVVGSTPKIVTDPFTGEVGYACAVSNNTTKLREIRDIYLNRAKGIIGCSAPTPTPTRTPTPTPIVECFSYEIQNNDSEDLVFEYTDCSGVFIQVTLSQFDVDAVCAQFQPTIRSGFGFVSNALEQCN